MSRWARTQLSRQTLIRAWIRAFQRELHPSRLIPSLTAALITGTIEVIYAISFVALIFSGNLAPYLTDGIGLALFSSMILSLIIALGCSLPGAVSGVQDAPAIILGVVATAIAAQWSASASTSASTASVLPTIVVALGLTSMLTGLCCFVLGHFQLGNLIRFIPYPVVGGFLAGTGWLIFLGALGFMTNLSWPGAEFLQLFQPSVLLQWLPGFCFGVLLLILLRRYHHFLLMPGLVLGAIFLFYVGLFATGTSTIVARNAGLLLQAFPDGSLWRPLPFSELVRVDWSLIGAQSGQMFVVMLITVLSILLNTTGIELAVQRDLELNRELRIAGIANLVAGLGGGIIGFHCLGVSILSAGKLGAKSRLVGVLIAAGMAIILLAGASLISLFPKPVLGGVTLFLGLDLLTEWIYDSWFKLPKTDYLMVILILVIIATRGVLPGVGIGLVLSIALFVINYSRVNVSKHTLSGATTQSHAARTLTQARLLQTAGEQIYILYLQGFLFFGTANTLLLQIQTRLHQTNLSPLKFVVLNFRSVNGFDSSAVLSFIKLKQFAQAQDLKLVLTDLSPTMQTQLNRGGCLTSEDTICQVFADLDRGLEWCENEILSQASFRRSRSMPLVLQLNHLFADPDQASEFMNYLEPWPVETGTMLFQQNQPVTALYLIESGQVTLLIERTEGHPYRLQTLGPGHLVGEVDFFHHKTHQVSATVEAPSRLYRLSTERFQHMQPEKPEIAAAFQAVVIRSLTDRLTSTYQEVADLLGS